MLQQTNRLAAVAQRHHEQSRAPVLAALWVPHHRAAAVIHLGFFARRGFDDPAGFQRLADLKLPHEAPHALVAGRETAPVHQLLPDRHGVAAPPQPPGRVRRRSPTDCRPPPVPAPCWRRPPTPRQSRESPPWPVLRRQGRESPRRPVLRRQGRESPPRPVLRLVAAAPNPRALGTPTRPPSSTRPPFPGVPPSSAVSASATIPSAPRRSLAVSFPRSRRCSHRLSTSWLSVYRWPVFT